MGWIVVCYGCFIVEDDLFLQDALNLSYSFNKVQWQLLLFMSYLISILPGQISSYM